MFRPEWFSVQFIDILAVNKIVIRAQDESPLTSSERFVVSWRCSWHCQAVPRLWSNPFSRFFRYVQPKEILCLLQLKRSVRSQEMLWRQKQLGAVTRSHLKQLSFNLNILPWHYVICLTQPMSTDLSFYLLLLLYIAPSTTKYEMNPFSPRSNRRIWALNSNWTLYVFK